MFTRRWMFGALTLAGAVGLLTVSLVAGRQTGRSTTGQTMPMPMTGSKMTAEGTMTMTKAQKIANAMSAGPSAIAAKATILDWPATENAKPETLRPGTNGWTCFPDMPMTKGNDPMCLDRSWMQWTEAYLAHKAPAITQVGIGYMIATGGGWGSNSDPYGMTETKDNHWGFHPPHVMILVPDTKALAGVSTDPANGGPYVMYAGTPYAHIMSPIAAMTMEH